MRLAFTCWWWLVAVFTGALVMTGCSSQSRHTLLTVFFTGVDAPAATAPVTASSIPVTNAVEQPAVQAPEPAVTLHKPFMERKCSACHLDNQSEQLRASGGELCNDCHRKLLDTAQVVHPLVAQGKCDQCHTPHKSPQPYLLLRPAQTLCQECHAGAKLEQVKGHATKGTATCLECHDPHRSGRAKLLKPAP